MIELFENIQGKLFLQKSSAMDVPSEDIYSSLKCLKNVIKVLAL